MIFFIFFLSVLDKTKKAERFMKIQNAEISSRLWFFILSSFALFSFFFAYDSPSPMYSGLAELFGAKYAEYHNLLYAAYALPNLLLPLLFNLTGGSEPTKMLYTYGLIVIGQTVFSIGVGLGLFECMLAGRFIIGLGGESFSIAQNKMLASLFSTGEHGRVFGISVAVGRCGSILAYLLLGSLITQGAFICSLVSMGFVWIGGVLILITYRKWEIRWEESTEAKEEDDIHELLPFFILMAVLVSAASSLFSSNNSVILQKRLSIDFKGASRALALQEAFALIFTVLISILTDKCGHRLSFICFGTLLLTAAHLLIFYSTPLFYVPVMLLGISSGFQACSWPCYPLLLAPNKLAIGLSLLSCFINMIYSVFPPLISKLTDSEFKLSEGCSVLLSGASSVISLYILYRNFHKGHGLNGTKHKDFNKI